MLAALRGGDAGAAGHWMANGGRQTLNSWGVPPSAPPARWWDAIPPAHLGFLRGLSLLHRAGGYVFVHAGLRPGVPLESQSRQDLLWIREPFLSWDGALPLVVVHGHTPEAAPVVRANRIGIDTGAVLGGKLTCAVLEDDTLAFMET
jgi:serine/threonine protein phosphatase 1